MKKDYELLAIMFSEKYGRIGKQSGKYFIFYVTEAVNCFGNCKTYKHTVNLDSMKESVTELKRVYRKHKQYKNIYIN